MNDVHVTDVFWCCAVAMHMKELMEGFVETSDRKPSTDSQSQSPIGLSFSCAQEREVWALI